MITGQEYKINTSAEQQKQDRNTWLVGLFFRSWTEFFFKWPKKIKSIRS